MIRQILGEAGNSPKAALMLLASELERELRRVLETAGVQPGPGGTRTYREAADLLRRQGAVPDDLLDSMIRFRDVRNRMLHGYEADPDDVLRAIDVGLRILSAVRALPEQQSSR